MSTPEIQRNVELHLAKGELREAVDLMMAATENSSTNIREKTINLSGRFYDWYQEYMSGNEVEVSEKNQIRKALLELVRELPDLDKPKFVSEPPAHNIATADPNAPIKVYLSVGTPHNAIQQRYLDTLKEQLATHKIQAQTLGSTFWSVKKPLLPIQKSMKEVSGCLVLALERFFAVEGIYKRGSEQEKKISQEQYSTPWSQIEAAMAYQAGLPLFIMKDENIRGEGMLDPATHDWMIVHINPEHPEELLKDPIRAFLKSWVEEVRAFHATSY
ncbi:MAG: hypothetical protein IPL27_02750 [Lewinellaceae bacterium]|nr:hypothetical protein [Lewinellaceae bacterium]